MFDKLVESNSAGAEFKPRRKFFMVSSVVVGILFLSAVVFSLYAQDIDLGTDDFELAELIAPVAPDAPEPEPPRQRQQRTDNENVSELPNRPELIARLADNVILPDTISTVPNTMTEIPLGRFTNNKDLPITEGAGDVGPIGNNGGGTSSSAGTEQQPTEVVKLPD